MSPVHRPRTDRVRSLPAWPAAQRRGRVWEPIQGSHYGVEPLVQGRVGTVKAGHLGREVRQVKAVARAGGGDVEQAAALAPLLGLEAALDGILERPDVGQALAALVHDAHPLGAPLARAAVDEDDAGLQALGLVDGEDLHGVRVGLEPLQVALLSRRLFRATHESAKPIRQLGQGRAGPRPVVLQELEDVHEVGQGPLARAGEKLAAQDPGLRDERREQPGDVAAARARREPPEDGRRLAARGARGRDLTELQGEEAGEQGPGAQAGILRRAQGAQHVQDLGRLVRREEIALLVEGVRDARARKGAADGPPFRVAEGQDEHVARAGPPRAACIVQTNRRIFGEEKPQLACDGAL